MQKRKRQRPGATAQAVIATLKRSGGLDVSGLTVRLGLSYMGVKSQCLLLEKRGYITSRNQHHGSGRPLLVYRLAAKGQAMFELSGGSLAISLLKEAIALFGANAADKLLYRHFQKLAEGYLARLPAEGSLQDRLAGLAEIRDAEGHMAAVEDGCIVESHNPLADVFAAFPTAPKLEEAAIAKALRSPVSRREERDGDHYQIRFEAFRCPDTSD